MKRLLKRRTFLTLSAGGAVGLVGRPFAALAAPAQGNPVNDLIYPLADNGWIHHFLLAGPNFAVIPDGEYKFNPELRPPIVQQMFRPEPEVTHPPVEDDRLSVDGDTLTWHTVSCDDDHLIDVSVFQAKSRYVRAWAYVELQSTSKQAAELHFFTNGPADVWLNGQHIARNDQFDYLNPHKSQTELPLQAGENRLLIRFEQAATRNSLTTLAARLDKIAPESVTVHLPTRTADTKTRQVWEAAFEAVHLGRDHYTHGDTITVLVPPLSGVTGQANFELRRAKSAPGASPVRRAVWKADGSASVSLGKAGKTLPLGDYQVLLTTTGANPSRRTLPLLLSGGSFQQTPAPAPLDTFDLRKAHLLEAFAKMPQTGDGWGGTGVFPIAARMETGKASEATFAAFESIIEGVNSRRDGSDFAMNEVLHFFGRFGDNSAFPAKTREKTRACILGFKYWSDEPGSVSMTFGSENHQMAFHTAEIIAGQRYPDALFTNNKKTGAWHKAHGEKLAENWLKRRFAYGMEEWDSDGYYEAEMKTLAIFAAHVQNAELRRMASNVLDKILLGMALNSYHGVFGSTHGRTGANHIKYTAHEPVSSAAWLLWGLGTPETPSGGAYHLAASERYKMPPVIGAIAADTQTLWNKEAQGLDGGNAETPQATVNKVTYKTADYMLCSAQDWKPGERGYQQHIWQGTLAPDAVLFSTHPACISENGNQRPNFWAGNATLPRVAQWKNTLIALYQLRPDDWLQWTHAYFPTWAFDEYSVENKWAFVRKNDGYAALYAANGLTLIKTGDSAYRELRSDGPQNAWICIMGRKADDGDFGAWQEKIKASPAPVFDKMQVSWTKPGGETVSFGWNGPLLANNEEISLNDFKHFDSPFCSAEWPAKTIEIKYGKDALKIESGLPVSQESKK